MSRHTITEHSYLPRIAARFISGFASRTSSRRGDSSFLSANSAGAVALEYKSTLRNGDPGGASGATAPLEFVTGAVCSNKLPVSDLIIDEFISDNLQDEYAIDIFSHKRPAGVMRGFAERTIGAPLSFPWLRRSRIRAFLSWRAERLARIISLARISVATAGWYPSKVWVTALSTTHKTLTNACQSYAARLIAGTPGKLVAALHKSVYPMSRPWGLHYRPQFL